MIQYHILHVIYFIDMKTFWQLLENGSILIFIISLIISFIDAISLEIPATIAFFAHVGFVIGGGGWLLFGVFV